MAVSTSRRTFEVVLANWQVNLLYSSCLLVHFGPGGAVAQRILEDHSGGVGGAAESELIAQRLADVHVAFQSADIGGENQVEHRPQFVFRHVLADAGGLQFLANGVDFRPIVGAP